MARDEAYQEAERRIEVARQEGATELALDLMGLTELPEAIATLTDLRDLNLSANPLNELPEAISSLIQLQSIKLIDNQLTELPKVITTLTQLESLYISRNNLIKLPEEISALTRLQTLDLSRNQLTELPEEIGALTQLQSLNLSRNELTGLPEAIASLTQLQTLNLSYNQLTELPNAIASLTQLQSLDLSSNQLTELPEVIASLTQLQSLDLSSNQLTELPEAIASLTQLQSLDLSSNQLTELPEAIASLTQLQELHLSRNQLSKLPTVIGEITCLERLSLFSNKLTSLPDELAQLENLKSLTLAVLGHESDAKNGNPLIQLPTCIRTLKNLITLQANDCQLNEVPEWISEVSTMESLFLEFNNLIDLPNSLGESFGLASLDLDGNPLNLDLASANQQGTEAVKQYLRARAVGEVTLHEAKLILVGEGEVGKSCLLGALREDEWLEDRSTTHGIEIKPVIVTAPDYGIEITLNGWDFGGQRVYRPTHQLFFSSSAVYLVVWKPREGPQQGFVKEWITLIKHREPDAKVLVVATHGGPGQRQPDIEGL